MNCHIIRIQRGGVRNREREWNGCVASRRRKASGCTRIQLHWLRCCCAQQLIGHIRCAASSHCAAAFNTCHAEFSFRRLRAMLLAMLLWSIHGAKVTESEATLSLVCNYPVTNVCFFFLLVTGRSVPIWIALIKSGKTTNQRPRFLRKTRQNLPMHS